MGVSKILEGPSYLFLIFTQLKTVRTRKRKKIQGKNWVQKYFTPQMASITTFFF